MTCDRPGLTPLEDAIDQLLEAANHWGTVVGRSSVDVLSAQGRVLADDIHADISVPGFDNSAMDGYALNLADWCQSHQSGCTSMPVSARIAAGQSPQALPSGTCARIFTGAAVPAGADVVVMQEDCTPLDSGAVDIALDPSTIHRGQNIRPAGQDVQQGDALLSAGRRLRAEDLGLLSSVGLSQITVFNRLKVAVIATGDELIQPGAALSPGQIYNSNTGTLVGLLSRMEVEVLPPFYAPDNIDKTQQVFQRAAEQADVIITTGGVSVGEEDHVRSVINSGGSLDLWRLAIKPGKPFAQGSFMGKPLLGLPGNPAAVVVTFYQLVRPVIHRLQGSECQPLLTLPGVAEFSTRKAIGRTEFLRARYDNGRVSIHPNQSSGVLSSASWGDGFARIPAGIQIARGDAVEFVGVSTILGQL